MNLGITLALALLALVASVPGPCEGAWTRQIISDGVSPTGHGAPSAGFRGVAWVSECEREQVLAFWDRAAARIVAPPSWWAQQPAASSGTLAHSQTPLPLSVGGPRPVYLPLEGPSLWEEGIAFSAGGYGLGPSSSDTEIFYWEQGASHRITYNSIADGHPTLFNGTVAWDNHSGLLDAGADSEIWFWNGYGAWQVTDNEVDDAYPSLYELTIAWQSDANIVYATIPSPEWGRPVTAKFVAQGERPSLFKNKIAYQASDGNDTEIFIYDIESQQTLQITNNQYNDGKPCLYDGTIVWHGYDGKDWEIFYWDGKSIQQLTDNSTWDGDPTLWGTGLKTTIAYVEMFSWTDTRIICLRPAVTASPGPGSGQITVTWPSQEGRAYRVEYTDDLITWKVAAESVASAGYGETSWRDGEASDTTPPPTEVPQRWYRVCETE